MKKGEYIERRGGKRPGAGRRRGIKTVACTVYLTEDQASMLKEWGGGNLSAGLRWVMKVAAPLVRKTVVD